MRKITYIVLHCTAGNPKAKVSDIQYDWKHNLGWKNPGYHYLIDYDGKVHNLQPELKLANGVAGHNAESIHVSYIGGVEGGKAKDTRSKAQKDSMAMLVGSLKQKYPTAKILGHRDLSPDRNRNGIIENWEWIKQCPSFDVAAWLIEINL